MLPHWRHRRFNLHREMLPRGLGMKATALQIHEASFHSCVLLLVIRISYISGSKGKLRWGLDLGVILC